MQEGERGLVENFRNNGRQTGHNHGDIGSFSGKFLVSGGEESHLGQLGAHFVNEKQNALFRFGQSFANHLKFYAESVAFAHFVSKGESERKS